MDAFLKNITGVVHNSTTGRNPYFVAVETSINALLTISAIAGNLLVCLAIYRNPSLRTVTNIFLFSLAIIDFLMAVLIMPINTASIIATRWITGEVGCMFNCFCTNTLTAASVMTIMLVAVNRYVRVVRPTFYPKIFCKTSGTAMAIGAWVLPSLIIFALYFIMRNTDAVKLTFRVYPVSCYHFFTDQGPSKLYAIATIVLLVVVSAVIVTCYVKIYQKLRHHNAAAAPSSQGGHSAYGVQEAMITKMLGCVVGGFYLCWLPYIAASIVGMIITIEEYVYKDSFSYISFPVFTSSLINPLVYSFFSRAFRKEFSKIIRFQGTS